MDVADPVSVNKGFDDAENFRYTGCASERRRRCATDQTDGAGIDASSNSCQCAMPRPSRAFVVMDISNIMPGDWISRALAWPGRSNWVDVPGLLLVHGFRAHAHW